MRRMAKLLSWLVLLPVLFVGCATSQKAIRTSSSVVTAAISAYAIYAVTTGVPEVEQDPVWAAYARYLAAEDAALDAYAGLAVWGERSDWERAKAAMIEARQAFLKLVPPEANGLRLE